MRVVSRRTGFPIGLLAVALLAPGCGSGGDEGAESSLLIPTSTAYVVRPPDTTTTTTTAAPPPPVADAATGAGGATGITPIDDGTYTVQSGDSVYLIADRYGIDPAALAQLNGWSDGVAHTINPGEVIRVAAASTSEQAATGADPGTSGGTGSEPPASTAANGDCPSTYTITAEDTSRIKVADRFGITYQEMDAANAATPGYDSFLIGTVITIPCPTG